jgi:hypothetical protein
MDAALIAARCTDWKPPVSPSGFPFSTMSASVSTSVKPTLSQSRVIMVASAA